MSRQLKLRFPLLLQLPQRVFCYRIAMRPKEPPLMRDYYSVFRVKISRVMGMKRAGFFSDIGGLAEVFSVRS